MKHIHHIVPKHMGGTDDPSNLIELSVTEHAEAHRMLYETYGLEQDLIAWRGLAGIIGHEEAVKMAQSLGGKNRVANGNPWSGKRTKMNFAENSELQMIANKKANSDESISKKKNTFVKIGHQQGVKNSQHGTCWVVHTQHGNKKISKDELDKFLSLGYTKGRKLKTA